MGEENQEEKKHRRGKERRKVHLVVAGASEFGQYACARVLHRAYAHVTKVTLIVARKDEQLFHKRHPAVAEWSHFPSLYECLEKLRSDGRPIDYVFDDHIQFLVTELLKEKGNFDRLGYVATRGEEHLPYTTILVTCCDRVLVEKPLSKCAEDVHPDGLFTKLQTRISEWSKKYSTAKVTTCEHFAFRKGFSDAREKLVEFINRHWDHGNLKYEFRFFEPARAEDLVKRLHAMQDGSILDIGVTHGLGPLSFILREKFGKDTHFDLHDSITWKQVQVKQARKGGKKDSPLIVPVLAETAAYLKGTYKQDDAHEIELEIKSGKGGLSFERYFKFICPECKRGEKDECYIGVSLGAAGYTECTWEIENGIVKRDRKLPDIVSEDGGWDSDRLGDTQPAAENAQAAMLETFIQGHDSRFIPLDQACQIVQLGIEAQAIGFCQERGVYYLDQKLDDQTEEDPNKNEQIQSAHKCLKVVWKEPKSAMERLKMALGIEKNGKLANGEKPCFRVITIFGPEGLGNTDISEKLHEALNDVQENKMHLIKVPRDIEWCHGRGSSAFGVERVMRDLGEKLNIATDVRKDTAADLCARIQDCIKILKRKPCILIINGIDRLGSEAYAQLICVLNQLPPAARIIMVTNKGEQTCGWVIRSEELIGENELLNKIKDVPDRHGGELRKYLDIASRSALSDEEKKNDFIDKILQFANDNLTIYRQLCSYFRFIVFPKITEMKLKLPKKELESIFDRELTALSFPRTITPYPEAMLNRISSLCIGAIQSAENLRLLRALAEVPDRIPKKFLDSLQPSLSKQMEVKARVTPLHSIIEHTPEWNDEIFNKKKSKEKSLKKKDIDEESDRNTFAIFPRVRMALFDHDGLQIQQICADVDRRRTSLSVPFDPEKPGKFYINLSLELFFNLIEERSPGSGSLDLESEDLFKGCYKELADLLERGHEGRPGNQSHTFLTTLLRQNTSPGLETLYGFGRLNLENGSLFGKRCKELSEALERSYLGRPDSRLHRFLTTLLSQKTNLGLETRAYMIALKAWMHLRSALNWQAIIPLLEQIGEAYEIDRKFAPFNEAFEDPFCRDKIIESPPGEEKSPPGEKKLNLDLIRFLVSTKMELDGVWYWLYGLEKPDVPRCSKQLEKKVKEAEDKIRDYVEKNPILSVNKLGNREKERLAVLMRVLSLLDAFKNEDKNNKSDKHFENEISRLNEAFGLLKDLLESIDKKVTLEEEGIFMRLGLNKSVCALLYFHRTKMEGNGKKEEALGSAARELETLNDVLKKYKFKFDMCPFALMALARLRDSGAEINLKKGKPSKLIKEARNLFLLRGRDYFAELAEKMKETFKKNAKTVRKNV
jgi:hypothetical protein